MNKKQPPYILIKDKAYLMRIAEDLKNEPEIGVDVEADSMFHYQERVCLIQVSTRLLNIIVDPLLIKDLSSLKPIFSKVDIRKVFHGADYDIRSLYRDFAIEVNNLFDTQIAARFLGIPEIGLAPLLKNRLGVSLDKKYQKRNWSVRPLSSAMLAYAVRDTSHLILLSQLLKKELKENGRLLWVEEESERLSGVRPIPPNGDPLYMRFKNARKLNPRDLAILESILQLREHTAKRWDRPPFKVLGNEPILEIVKKKPMTKNDLKNITGLSLGMIKKLGPSILKKISESLNLPQNQLPIFPKKIKSRIGNEVSERIKTLRVWRDRRAKEMDMAPDLICTNAQIEALAHRQPKNQKELKDIDVIRAWQRRLYGDEICEFLK